MPGPGSGPAYAYREVIIDYGTRALHAAMRGDLVEAMQVVMELDAFGATEGPNMVLQAMLAWIDTLLGHLGRGLPPTRHLHIVFLDSATAQMHGADQAPPEALWAARVIQARHADNEAAFNQAIQDMPADGHGIAAHICAVLTACAWGLNNIDKLRAANRHLS